MSKHNGCINEDNSHWCGSLSNNKVMTVCGTQGRAQGGGRRRRNGKSKRAGKRGGGRLYSLLANVDQKILGRAAGSGAYVAVPGDDVGLNACTNGTSRQYYNEELYGLKPLKAASLSGGSRKTKRRGGRKSKRRGSKRRGSKRGGSILNFGGTQSGCGCGYSLGDDYTGKSCDHQLGFSALAGGRKKKRSRVSKKKGGSCGCGLKGGKRRTRRTRRRHGKRGGSTTPTAFKDPNGYSLGGPGYTPKELLYGALSTPAPYKPYNNCN